MLRPTAIHEKNHDLSNLRAKILNCIGVVLHDPTLFSAQFAAPEAQFAGARYARAQFATAPKSVGPNLPPNRRGAQFAIKSARGPIYLEPK